MPFREERREEGTVLASLCHSEEKERRELSWPRYAIRKRRGGGNCLGLVMTGKRRGEEGPV